MNFEDLKHKSVIDSSARRIGNVENLVFNLPPGQITHITIKTGIVSRRSVPVELVDKVGDAVILKVPESDLKD